MIFRSRCRNPNNTLTPEPLSLLTESRSSPYIAKNTLDKTQSKQLGPHRRKGLADGELRPVLAGGPRGEPGAPAPHPWGRCPARTRLLAGPRRVAAAPRPPQAGAGRAAPLARRGTGVAALEAAGGLGGGVGEVGQPRFGTRRGPATSRL
jgi:hypothetical protein